MLGAPERRDRFSAAENVVPQARSADRQGAVCCDEAMPPEFPAAFFLRARRFKVAVGFKGLRRALSSPFNA